MDVSFLVIGVFVGLVLSAKGVALLRSRKRSEIPTREPRDYLTACAKPMLPRLPYTPRDLPLRPHTAPRRDDPVADLERAIVSIDEAIAGRTGLAPPPHRRPGNEPFGSRSIMEDWRKSIVALIKLAESNLKLAESQASMMNYKGAVEAAATSVENVSRALLHCFGEKPELSPGQETPLRLLARRLHEEERSRFEKAIEEALRIHLNRMVEADLAGKGVQETLLNEARTKQTIETALEIRAQFKRIMEEHFSTEIPELGEKCPKCNALDVSLWAFNQQQETCQCNICDHKWIQPSR